MTVAPYYFGNPPASLFGCFHASARPGPAKRSVLLCNAMGHEYMALHRTVRQTAVRLARDGSAALRFDFYGAGDSAGDSSDGSPSRWVDDIGVAADELRRRQGTRDVSFVGWRLGATLALQYLQRAERVDARALVLWDPVILGRAYADELTALQRERFGRTSGDEILGFPWTERMRSEVEAIDLSKTNRAPARDVLIVETGDARAETRAFVDRLRELGSIVEHRSFADAPIWHEPNKSAVPAKIVQAVVAWVGNNSGGNSGDDSGGNSGSYSGGHRGSRS